MLKGKFCFDKVQQQQQQQKVLIWVDWEGYMFWWGTDKEDPVLMCQ